MSTSLIDRSTNQFYGEHFALLLSCDIIFLKIEANANDIKESPPEDHAGKSTVHLTDSPNTWQTWGAFLWGDLDQDL